MNHATTSIPITLGQCEPSVVTRASHTLFSLDSVFTLKSYTTLQRSFSSLPWKKKETDFYTQFEAVVDPGSNSPFASLYRRSFYDALKARLEAIIKAPLRDTTKLIAHKLNTSHAIDVHTDFCDPALGYEQYRLVFQFGPQEALYTGGELAFLASEDKTDIVERYAHGDNRAICFEIAPTSYHYVTPVEGERYTLIMYLWGAGRPYDGSGYEVQ